MLSHFINILNIPYKFSIDLMWNCGSFVVMGICGIAINIIIAKTYGLEILGVFNQVYAIYILISQFSTGGVQFSVLKNIAIYSGNKKVSSMILVSGLLLAIIYPIPFIIIIFFLKECVGELLKSKGVSVGILYILPGIFFFSINKIFLAFHNGRRRMKSFAIFQSIRYLGILAALLFFAIISFDGYKISMAFTISEIILFALISLYSIRYLKIHFSKEILKWLRIHFYFGIKGILGNVYAELNTRADVIMLGFFCSDRSVGIYSFAAMLAEGFGQIATIVQGNLNPII